MKIVMILAFFAQLIFFELQSYNDEHLIQLNTTGVCTFCDLVGLKSNNLNLNPGVQITDLSGSDLRWSRLSDLDLQNIKLNNVNLEFARLSRVNLKKADLSNARLLDVELHRVNLRETCLDFANFSHAIFYKVDLRNLRSSIGTIWPNDLDQSNPARCLNIPMGEIAPVFSDSEAESVDLEE